MILDQLSKIILKREYHLNYMPKESKWTIITRHFPILYEIHSKPIEPTHLLSILHLILETNRLFIVSSSYFLMTRLLRFTCYVLILYGIRKYEWIQYSMMDYKTITITNWVSRFHQLPSFYQQYITGCYFTRKTTTNNVRQKNCISTKGLEPNYTEIKRTHFLGVLLVKNFTMQAISLLLGDLPFTRFSGVPFKASMPLNTNGGRRQLKQRNELTRNGKVKWNYKLAIMKYIIEEKPFQKLFNMIHLYDQIRRNKGNSRTSLFEEGALDVAQNIAREPIFYYSGQVHIRGPLNAYWVKGESLGPDTYNGILPRDHKYL